MPAFFGAVVIFVIFFSLAMTIADQWSWFKDGTAASWAQAVAAFVAIGFGAAGLWWQAERLENAENKRLVAEDIRRLQIIFAALFDIYTRLKLKTCAELGAYQAEWGAVDKAVNLIDSVNVLDIPDWKITFAMRQAIDRYRDFRVIVPYPGTSLPPLTWHQDANKSLDDSVVHFHKSLLYAHDAIENRKGKVPKIEVVIGEEIIVSDKI